MKLILSRKGFDSSSGGCPNPIFPDGRMLALPIPDRTSRVKYQDLSFDEFNVGTLVHQLTRGRARSSQRAHLDPDLHVDMYPRAANWRPVLGQHGAAQGHLKNQGVEAGDLFLFFGLFQQVEKVNRRWQFAKASKPRHVIWGWLHVSHTKQVAELSEHEKNWLAYHPHLQWPDEKNNTLYFASQANTKTSTGSGVFMTYDNALCLSDPKAVTPSFWRLPGDFYPGDRAPLSYHHNPDRWQAGEETCRLKSAARGQEFVLDLESYPEILDWAQTLIRQNG